MGKEAKILAYIMYYWMLKSKENEKKKADFF